VGAGSAMILLYTDREWNAKLSANEESVPPPLRDLLLRRALVTRLGRRCLLYLLCPLDLEPARMALVGSLFITSAIEE
jgi:hypothetical protein